MYHVLGCHVHPVGVWVQTEDLPCKREGGKKYNEEEENYVLDNSIIPLVTFFYYVFSGSHSFFD